MPVVRIRYMIASAGEFGFEAVRLPAPLVLLEVFPVSLAVISVAPLESSSVSVRLAFSGVRSRRGSPSSPMNTTSPATALNE
jgi:hypothetical protein